MRLISVTLMLALIVGCDTGRGSTYAPGEAAPAPTLVVPQNPPATAFAPTQPVLPTDTPRPLANSTVTVTEEVLGSTRGISLPLEHLWLARPVEDDAPATSPAPWYAYGSTLGGQLRVHHGVEFVNPEGTPLVAVGPGTVVAAGPDLTTIYGLGPDFYGKLVVLRLDQNYAGRLVYVLYGHMAHVDVSPREHVATGDLLGTVGATGVANGAHLHMEVRLDTDSYDTTRNPELWLNPKPGTGVIAGRVVDAAGNFLWGQVVDIFFANSDTLLSEHVTYGDESVHPDEALNENFATTDVPAGDYVLQVTIKGKFYTWPVTVTAGHVSLVQMQVGP